MELNIYINGSPKGENQNMTHKIILKYNGKKLSRN